MECRRTRTRRGPDALQSAPLPESETIAQTTLLLPAPFHSYLVPTPPGADLSRQGTIDQEYRFPGFVVPKPVAESQPPPAESPRKLMIANADSLKRHGAVHGKTEEGEGAEKVGGTESPVVEEWVEVPTPKIVVKPPTADPIPTSTATPLSPTSSTAYPIPHGLESEGPTPSSTAATRQTGASALYSIWSNVSSAIPPVKVKHDQRLMVASLALIALESLTNVALLISIMVVHSWIINWLPTFASKASPSSATAWFDVLVALWVSGLQIRCLRFPIADHENNDYSHRSPRKHSMQRFANNPLPTAKPSWSTTASSSPLKSCNSGS